MADEVLTVGWEVYGSAGVETARVLSLQVEIPLGTIAPSTEEVET